MDTSVLDRNDYDSIANRAQLHFIKSKEDRKINVVKISMFIAGSKARQTEAIKAAVALVACEFKKNYNVIIETEEIDNDTIFTKNRWTPFQLFQHMAKSDIHLISCHGHQGNIGRKGPVHFKWTIDSYLRSMRMLRYHLGCPMGMFMDCPVFTQDKVCIIIYISLICL